MCVCAWRGEELGHGHDTAASPSCVLLISQQSLPVLSCPDLTMICLSFNLFFLYIIILSLSDCHVIVPLRLQCVCQDCVCLVDIVEACWEAVKEVSEVTGPAPPPGCVSSCLAERRACLSPVYCLVSKLAKVNCVCVCC